MNMAYPWAKAKEAKKRPKAKGAENADGPGSQNPILCQFSLNSLAMKINFEA